MQKQRKKVGRPSKRPRIGQKGEKATLGIRVPLGLKRRLDTAAEANDRSLSQEAELRLEQSFRNEDYLDQAMNQLYGPRLAVLLTVIGRALNEIGRHAPGVSFPANWMDVPHIFHEAVGAVEEALEAFRPEGKRPSTDPILAPKIIRELLDAIRVPEQADDHLKEWAARLHAKLGERAAARLRIKPWAGATEVSPGKFKAWYRPGSNQ